MEFSWQVYLIDAYILLFLVSLINYLFRDPIGKGAIPPVDKKISVLIPARNEEQNLGNLLESLLRQEHPPHEILVYDDESTDGTAALVRQYEQQKGTIRLISSTGLPEGWLGKNHACYRLAQEAKGDYLLFLDADVRLESKAISRLLHYADHKQLSLVSVFPKQEFSSLGEQATVPIMNQILLSLLPLPAVRYLGFSSMAAANGQFMLFEKESYLDLQPHREFRMEKVEDIHIARHFKKSKRTIACLASEETVSCRMYRSTSEAIQGFSRNIHHYFGGSHALALLYWLFHVVVPMVFLLSDNAIYFLLVVVLGTARRSLNSLTSHQSMWLNNRMALIQHFYFAIILFYSYQKTLQKSFQWKGRSIS